MNERNRKRPHYGKKYPLPTIAIAAGCVLLVLVLLAVFFCTKLELNLVGEQEITVEYGDQYRELGATATSGKKNLEVTVEGTVDAKTLGTYQITYSAKYLWMSESVQRTVHVVDTVAPVITLKTKPDHITLPGADYEEEGYAASDNYDGDITDKVTTSFDAEKGVMVYTVKDSSGNETRVERVIKYTDPIAPEITLSGDSEITLQAGNSYKEPGYTAKDNVDGDITDKVQVESSLNTNRAGTYTITYSVTDSYGNTTKVTRTVKVKAASQPDVNTPGRKVIYLTFDDGPSRHTQTLLDVLAKYNAKATFFVVNTGYQMKKTLNAIVDGGHAIGIHSVSHEYEEIYASEDAFFNDLYGMQKIIKDHTGVTTTLMRFPGGSSNAVSKFNPGIMTRLTQAVQDQGFQYFDWNVSSGDAGGTKDTDQIVKNVTQGIAGKKTAVVLQHDLYSYSVAAVEEIIQWGLANGYTFEALTPSSPVCHHPVNN